MTPLLLICFGILMISLCGLRYGPVAWQSWSAGGRIALHAFEMEVMIL